MEKEFVPYELALKLKALGFDERCLKSYGTDGLLNQNDHEMYLSAPLYQQAFRWFRENYNLYHTIDKQGYWFFQIKKDEGFGDLTEVIVTYDYNSHEEAELHCLEKLIEIVESK